MSIHRHMKFRETCDIANDWLHNKVYTGLSTDDLTRCGSKEYRLKRDAICSWWVNFTQEDYEYTMDDLEQDESDTESMNTDDE